MMGGGCGCSPGGVGFTKDVCCQFVASVVAVGMELVRQGALSGRLYGDDLVLMSETIEELGNKFGEWKEHLTARV